MRRRRRRERRPLPPRPAQARRGPPARLPFARGPSARFREAGRNRGPSSSKSRAAAARCSSPSRIRPWRASAASSISCARRSKGASSSHFSRLPNALVGSAPREMLEEGDLAPAEAPPLGGEPAVEGGTAFDFQSFQEVAVEKRGQRLLAFRRERVDSRFGRAGDLERVDEAIREVEPDGVVAGFDAAAARSVNEPPDLAQAPAQLPARIVRHVPQQLAKLAPRHRRAARGRDRRRARAPCARPAAPARARPGGSPAARASAPRSQAQSPARAPAFRIHGLSHARYHAR